MKHPDADSFIANLIDSSDFQTAYAVLDEAFKFLCHRELEEMMGVSRSRERFAVLLDRARGKHGELTDLLLPVFEEAWRQSEITQRRTEIKSQDHRFFLALLLNVPERKDMLRLVKEKFPAQDPVNVVVGWVKELSATKIFGSKEPNVLGVADFNGLHLLAVKALLEGRTPAELSASVAPDNRFAGSSSIQDVANQLRSLPLFQAIFHAE
jgi:hypothetical protein